MCWLTLRLPAPVSTSAEGRRIVNGRLVGVPGLASGASVRSGLMADVRTMPQLMAWAWQQAGRDGDPPPAFVQRARDAHREIVEAARREAALRGLMAMVDLARGWE